MAGRPREFDDQQVIDAAMDAFWRDGYEATSAQALVESTGLGRGSLYAAFGNKEKLYHEALRRYHQNSIDFHQEIFARSGSVAERLRLLLQKGTEIDLSNVERNGCMAIFSPLERSAKDATVDRLSRHYIKQLEQMFALLFAQGITSGEFPADRDASVMAKSFMCGYFGFRVFGRIVHEADYQQQAIDALLRTI
ncbi:TetR/AcrR family transcriptional regulator [Erwinia sp. S43]|uniref:TetR family transcriptional regulator n=2 Tax=Erwiniaceae TaxID=1903409 RepID=A0A2S9I9G9_9GAMM|nr:MULTISPECIES: TetR/AcrR family transcriptional regulator [Erwiniaceae]MBK0002698.1 TetR/AcrR family transcriptional regulator [Erwinia sp. S38]MBK0030965.1 TetR/AcrR family transcriptional regulator [Erwinia sp. S43]PRD14425.1 TetR family transcriptional regulator [Pantoea coffeiphila]